jgi:methyl-accepting chemotaxis protein
VLVDRQGSGARTRLTEEHGFAGKFLVGAIAWALGAVLMLSSTLVSAQQIDRRVDVIKHTVTPIDHDLDSVRLTGEIAATAAQIDAAAKPLPGQLNQVVQATGTIDTSAKSILASSESINRTVHSIDGNAQSINENSRSINGTVHSINGTSQAIEMTVQSVLANAESINASSRGINDSFGAVLGLTESIKGPANVPEGTYGGGFAGSSRRALRVIANVTNVRSDLDRILEVLPSIINHAESIDQKTPGTGYGTSLSLLRRSAFLSL